MRLRDEALTLEPEALLAFAERRRIKVLAYPEGRSAIWRTIGRDDLAPARVVRRPSLCDTVTRDATVLFPFALAAAVTLLIGVAVSIKPLSPATSPSRAPPGASPEPSWWATPMSRLRRRRIATS